MVHSLSKKIYDTNIEGIVTNLCKIILHVFVVMRLLQSICVYLTHIYLTQIRRPCKTSRYYTSIIKIFRHQTRFLSTQSLALLITSADSLWKESFCFILSTVIDEFSYLCSINYADTKWHFVHWNLF